MSPDSTQAPAVRERTVLAIAVVVALLHAAIGARYDLFRDELYFIVCGQHPAFGYADQPPLVPLIAASFYRLGLGAFGVRLPLALAAGAMMVLAVRFSQLLGGKRLAIVLATLAVCTAPMLLGMSAVLSTTSFDPLAWTMIAYCFVRAIRQGEDRFLIVAGLVAGLDLQAKYALPFWATGLAIGLLATPQRRLLLRPALWLGLVLAGLIALPSFLWQMAHGFPFLELMAAAKEKNADTPLGSFLLNQVFVMNPLLAPVWIAGLLGPFLIGRMKDLRFLPIACVVVFILTRLGHGKDYYLAACYPTLFVLGACAIAQWAGTIRRRRVVMAGAGAAVLVSVLLSPIALPVLPPPLLVAYVTRLGIAPQQQERSFRGTVLPQLFADQLGWHDFAGQVISAWHRIPENLRGQTGIKVDNYGEAASLDLYAGPLGLPPVLSGHNQYFLWGLRGQNPTDMLVVQNHVERLRPYCRETLVLGETSSPYAMAFENGKVIAWCRGLRQPLQTLWPEVKNYS
ncbi:ArnT family glycosyltransferase [Novosphingobium terrae]|uniref:ArnT family glycosyltransferase n=1 Tax=Novosphingobium terrae TaxID=2726189 RepID=UPI00197D4684|nr:glycosyltransferase family 39 protein [Novosphingobium terrae]